ncbi:MAG: hypothetical protein ACP5IT_10635, partial [Thermoproteota archaeon]
MNLQNFITFVLKNPSFRFPRNLERIAQVVLDLYSKGEELTFTRISREVGKDAFKIKKIVESFNPEEINIEKAKTHAFRPPPPERQRGDLAQKQVEMALGDAYVAGVKQLA